MANIDKEVFHACFLADAEFGGLVRSMFYQNELSADPLAYFNAAFKCATDGHYYTATIRRKVFINLVNFYNEYIDSLRQYYTYFPGAYKYVDRFVSTEKTVEQNSSVSNTTSVFESTSAKQNIPSTSGLYLIGQCAFNPFTYEEFYWVKVGKSSNISNRMTQYASHSPMIWKQDFLCADKNIMSHLENACHTTLSKIAIGVGEKSQEWFKVTREDYLEICEKQFKYFFPDMEN